MFWKYFFALEGEGDMFIVTARIPKKRLLAAAVAVLCCCAAVLTGIFCAHGLSAVSASSPVSGEVKGLRGNDDRAAFLRDLGWEISEDPISAEELLIPEVFDESYDDYLALQAGQGFDLTAYCGKRVKRYTYEVVNHPSGETGVQAALLIYKNRLVGGEVLSARPDGFIHGLAMPETGLTQ